MKPLDLEVLNQRLSEYFHYTETNGWHIGEWKESGIVLFKKRIFGRWNLVLRLVHEIAVTFLEEDGVTKALKALNFDKYLLQL